MSNFTLQLYSHSPFKGQILCCLLLCLDTLDIFFQHWFYFSLRSVDKKLVKSVKIYMGPS